MNLQLLKAKREQVVIKLGLQGPSGSGKTYSALLLAKGLVNDWSKVALIDSENHSAALYAHMGEYNVVNIGPPFSSQKYIDAISLCESASMEVIIIDSISHQWDGPGGIIDVHSSMLGNSFANWGKVLPSHNAFVSKMLQSPCHIISTIRSKTDYVLSEKNGKMVPEKVGLKGVTREGMDFELTIVLELDIRHQATATKDRTGLFTNPLPFTITEQTGSRIRTWCQGEDLIKRVESQIKDAKTVQELRNILIKYPSLRKDIEPLCVNRKAQIEEIPTDQVVNPQK